MTRAGFWRRLGSAARIKELEAELREKDAALARSAQNHARTILAAEAALREARERLEHSAMAWHITQHEGDIASCPDRACVANLAVLARAGEPS